MQSSLTDDTDAQTSVDEASVIDDTIPEPELYDPALNMIPPVSNGDDQIIGGIAIPSEHIVWPVRATDGLHERWQLDVFLQQRGIDTNRCQYHKLDENNDLVHEPISLLATLDWTSSSTNYLVLVPCFDRTDVFNQ